MYIITYTYERYIIKTANARPLEYLRKHLWLKNREAGFGCVCPRRRGHSLLPKRAGSRLGLS